MDGNIQSEIPIYRIGILQSRANRNLQELRDTTLKVFDLTSPEWFALGHIAHETPHGGIKVGRIAEELDVQSTYATAILRRLEAKGLVEVRQGTTDRRVRMVSATAKGLSLATASNEEIAKQGLLRLDDIPEEVMRHYLTVLEAFAR